MARIASTLVLLLIASAASAQAPKLPTPDHIVIVIEENKGYDDIIGSKHAPYLNALAGRGALMTDFYASHHPSQPNYVDFFAGDTLGVCDDTCPAAPFTAENLASALIAKGLTFTGYAQSLPPPKMRSVCRLGEYAKKHCPWLDFSNVPASSSKDFDRFPKDAAGFAALPTVSLVIPNLVFDMHDGVSVNTEVKVGDKWLSKNLEAYAAWAIGNNSLLIVTWDEDSWKKYTIKCPSVIITKKPENRIATIVVGQPVKVTQSTIAYTHTDLLRTILDMYGITPFGNAVTAKDIDDIWN